LKKDKEYIELSDEELMVLIQDHHSQLALTELYKRYSKKLLGFFFKMFHKDEELAHDCVQEVFLKIMEKKHQFDTQKKFYTWLFTIARNMSFSVLRNQRIERTTEQIAFQAGSLFEENRLDKKLFAIKLEASIEALEPQMKATFVLRYMEHFSLQEIAEITEVSLGTVKSRLFYTTRKIVLELKDFDPTYQTNMFNLM
jgi:RNA polymerase sigma-70 factor (ECF subfamily)